MRPSPTTTARRLAEAIERAARLGLAAHADRLAQSAARLMHHSSRLTECIARLRLAQGNAETALSIIEGSRLRTDSLRLLRSICLIELGRAIEAEMDLRAWVRDGVMPVEARRLLALLQTALRGWQSTGFGDAEARREARTLLSRNVTESEDARSIELFVIDAVEGGRDDEATHWARRLARASRWCNASIEPAILIESLGVETADDGGAEQPAEREIAMLAMEIGACEDVVPALVRAQQIAFDPFASALLYAAVERSLPEFANEAVACESLARLAMLMDQREDAMRWVRRGLERNPMSASLALLAHEVGADETPRQEIPMRRAA